MKINKIPMNIKNSKKKNKNMTNIKNKNEINNIKEKKKILEKMETNKPANQLKGCIDFNLRASIMPDQLRDILCQGKDT